MEYRGAVLAPEIRFEGWDTTDWVRLLSLFEAPAGGGAPPGPGGLFVVHDGRAIRKLLHARVGRLSPAGQRWGKPLEELAREHGAAWVVALHDGALEELMDRLGGRVVRGDDLLEQAIKGLEIARELAEEGAIQSWPQRLKGVPLPSPAVIRGGLDALCPAGKTAVVGLFERGELWSALVIARGPLGIDRVLGPELLRPAIGLLSGDFRRDYWHLMRAVERQVGPLHIGLFTEVSTLRRLVTEGRAGSWARAVAVRDVVVSPMPAAVAVPLGVDAARGLTRSTAVVLSRLNLDSRIAAAVAAVRSPEARGSLLVALRQLIDKLSR